MRVPASVVRDRGEVGVLNIEIEVIRPDSQYMT
jgi:hypothetical protein